MMKIKKVIGREILDSRGNPTLEVEVILKSGHMGRMMVPAGASTGRFEAMELRDGEMRYRGKGVTKAVNNINTTIQNALIDKNPQDQEGLDQLMIELDGSLNKSTLGANAILGVSLALAHVSASANGKPLFQYLAQKYLSVSEKLSVPLPMVNIISGGLHAGHNIDVQDFLVIPVGAKSYPEALEMVSNVYWKTREMLNKKGYNAYLLADEGGFGPKLSSNKEALEILCEVFEMCKYKPEDMAIALDIASSQFYNPEEKMYCFNSDKRSLDSSQMVDMLEKWTIDYPIISIEDGLAENDWEGWQLLTLRLGKKIQLIGDDLFTTNTKRIQKGIDMKAGNAVLIKMNQIGTLTETVKAIEVVKEAGFRTIISARSGETEDATLADLAVGLNGGQIKIGSLAGSSRLAKYNQLLRISEGLAGGYAGNQVFTGKLVL
jgi:enolase